MADDSSAGESSGDVDTGGGAYVAGGVQVGRDFIGRDNILNVTLRVAGGDLQALTDTLFGLLAAPDVQIRANRVTAGERSVEVRPELADALCQFLDAAPGTTQAERERQYLLHLCVDPDFSVGNSVTWRSPAAAGPCRS